MMITDLEKNQLMDCALLYYNTEKNVVDSIFKLYCTALYCTVLLYCTLLYSTLLYGKLIPLNTVLAYKSFAFAQHEPASQYAVPLRGKMRPIQNYTRRSPQLASNMKLDG